MNRTFLLLILLKNPTISYMVTTENFTDRLKDIIANYEQSSGNNIDVQSYPASEFENLLKVKMISGEGPDLFTTDDIIAAQFMLPRDWFEDLSSRDWTSRLSEAGKSILEWNDGAITGPPITNPGGFGMDGFS